MISKELLSEVLGRDILYCDMSTINTNQIDYIMEFDKSEYHENRTINIYELAHKCKEWATSQGFIVLTYGEAYYNVDVHYHSNKSKFGHLAFSDTAQEEPEAIFKACAWILNNKESE